MEFLNKTAKKVAVQMRKIIEKKILQEYFLAVIHGEKTFEIRKDEDNLQKGDILILREWDGEKYTGRETSRYISYPRSEEP